jgi:hypothetical protein
MFEKRCCSKEGGDYTQADADANHDQSVAVGVFDCASEAVHTDDLAFDDYLLEEIIDEMNAEADHTDEVAVDDYLLELEEISEGETLTLTVPTYKTCSCRDEFCEECNGNGDDNNGSLNEDDRKKLVRRLSTFVSYD